MKVLVFNDRSIHIGLRVIDPSQAMFNDNYGTLAPQEAVVVDIAVPEGHTIYIKDWDNCKLVATIPIGVLTQFPERVKVSS